MRTRAPRALCGLCLGLMLLACPDPARALFIGGLFGPNGEGGDVNGQLFLVGNGRVHEVDAFVALDGLDLNGGAFGTSAQLSLDALPADVDYTFDAALVGVGGALLSYRFANTGAAALPALTFLSFLDAEVVETNNTFFNEYASMSGVAAAGQHFEVDEPGFTFGDIFDNLLLGTLDDTNALPAGSPDDVSMALSFELGVLQPGEIAVIEMLISDAGEMLDGKVLQHFDPDDPTVVTFSGEARVVPEPGTASLLVLGTAALARTRRRRRR